MQKLYLILHCFTISKIKFLNFFRIAHLGIEIRLEKRSLAGRSHCYIYCCIVDSTSMNILIFSYKMVKIKLQKLQLFWEGLYLAPQHTRGLAVRNSVSSSEHMLLTVDFFLIPGYTFLLIPYEKSLKSIDWCNVVLFTSFKFRHQIVG